MDLRSGDGNALSVTDDQFAEQLVATAIEIVDSLPAGEEFKLRDLFPVSCGTAFLKAPGSLLARPSRSAPTPCPASAPSGETSRIISATVNCDTS